MNSASFLNASTGQAGRRHRISTFCWHCPAFFFEKTRNLFWKSGTNPKKLWNREVRELFLQQGLLKTKKIWNRVVGRFFKIFSSPCHKIAVLTASYSEGTIVRLLKKFPRQVVKTPFPLPRTVREDFLTARAEERNLYPAGCKNAFPTASYSEGTNSSKII